MIDEKYLAKFGFELIVDLFDISKNDSEFKDYKVDMKAVEDAIRSQNKHTIIQLNKYLSNKYPIGLLMFFTGSNKVSDNTLYEASLEDNIHNLIKIRWAINKVGSESLVKKLLEASVKAGFETIKDYAEDKLIEGIMGEDAAVINKLRDLDDAVSKAKKLR